MKESLPSVRAAFVTQHVTWPWRRQFPAGQDIIEGVQFFVPIDEADVVFVYDALPESCLDVPARALLVFISSEPENVKRYNSVFLAQFDLVVTTDRTTPHANRLFTQPGLPWHVGSMTEGGSLLSCPMSFEDFERHNPIKTRLVSIVSSDKAFTPEHRSRLAFVARLKEAFGDQVDFFGRGIADFSDKRDVLDSYRYHVALENCAINDYWTEKLADPLLTLTFPIYHGCPNVNEYFSEHALRRIDIYKPNEAIQTIREVINSDLAERCRGELVLARRRLMKEHNVFALLARIAGEYLPRISLVRRVSQGMVSVRCEDSYFPAVPRWKGRLFDFLSTSPFFLKTVRSVKRSFHL